MRTCDTALSPGPWETAYFGIPKKLPAGGEMVYRSRTGHVTMQKIAFYFYLFGETRLPTLRKPAYLRV